MFKKKHLFVELHELRGDEWHETKRANHGLEEDLDSGQGAEVDEGAFTIHLYFRDVGIPTACTRI